MQFVSLEFIQFLIAAFSLIQVFPLAGRKYYLLAVSYFFYFLWNAPYALLLLCVTAVVFQAAKKIEGADGKNRVSIMAAMAAVLVLLLCFFKYANPVFAFVSEYLDFLKTRPLRSFFQILMPVGISYYTFKMISYIVDVYWEKIPAERDFASFAAYVVFFPQILSGPIQRAETFLPQIKDPQPVSYDMLTSGMRLLLFGFFKKLVIADRLALFVDGVYSNPASFNSATLVLSTYAYVFQLYADFSGLTDIARGSARFFGIQSPKNFDLPFWASNIQQYWRRWHMTLTHWLGDYVFNPLRMTFRDRGQAGLILAVMINMILIGIWHGAKLTFVAFGIIHGIFMVISMLTLKKREIFFKKHPRLAFWRPYWAPIGVFQLVALGAIFFRADTLPQALSVIQNILIFDTSKANAAFFGKKEILICLAGILMMETIHYFQIKNKIGAILKRPAVIRWSAYYVLAGAVFAFGQFAAKEFIYFKF